MSYKFKISLTGHRSAIYKLIDLSASEHFLSMGGDGMIVKWTVDGSPDGHMIADAGEQVFAAHHLVEKNWLVAGGMSGNLIWLDLDNKAIIKKIKQHKKSVFDVCRIPGQHILTVSGDGSLCIWDDVSQNLDFVVQISSQGLRKMCLLGDEWLLIGGSDGYIYQLSRTTWQIVYRHAAHDNSVFSLAYNGQYVFSGGRDALLKSWMWENEELKPVRTVNAHWYTINDILVDSSEIITGSRDKKIRFWTPELDISSSISFAEQGHVNSVNTLIRKLDWLISAGDDRSIIIWEKQN